MDRGCKPHNLQSKLCRYDTLHYTCVMVRIDKSLNRGLHFRIIVLLRPVVFQLKHFDPCSVSQNSRAPSNYEAAHPKRKRGVLAEKIWASAGHRFGPEFVYFQKSAFKRLPMSKDTGTPTTTLNLCRTPTMMLLCRTPTMNLRTTRSSRYSYVDITAAAICEFTTALI
jgi:hypothetical protein